MVVDNPPKPIEEFTESVEIPAAIYSINIRHDSADILCDNFCLLGKQVSRDLDVPYEADKALLQWFVIILNLYRINKSLALLKCLLTSITATFEMTVQKFCHLKILLTKL